MCCASWDFNQNSLFLLNWVSHFAKWVQFSVLFSIKQAIQARDHLLSLASLSLPLSTFPWFWVQPNVLFLFKLSSASGSVIYSRIRLLYISEFPSLAIFHHGIFYMGSYLHYFLPHAVVTFRFLSLSKSSNLWTNKFTLLCFFQSLLDLPLVTASQLCFRGSKLSSRMISVRFPYPHLLRQRGWQFWISWIVWLVQVQYSHLIQLHHARIQSFIRRHNVELSARLPGCSHLRHANDFPFRPLLVCK